MAFLHRLLLLLPSVGHWVWYPLMPAGSVVASFLLTSVGVYVLSLLFLARSLSVLLVFPAVFGLEFFLLLFPFCGRFIHHTSLYSLWVTSQGSLPDCWNSGSVAYCLQPCHSCQDIDAYWGDNGSNKTNRGGGRLIGFLWEGTC